MLTIYDRTHSPIDSLFNSFFNVHQEPSSIYTTKITENGKIEYSVDLPGVKKSDVRLTVNGRTIKLEAQRDNGKRKLDHSWTISSNYDTSTIDAKLEDGVLTIKIDQREDTKPKEIEVKIT